MTYNVSRWGKSELIFFPMMGGENCWKYIDDEERIYKASFDEFFEYLRDKIRTKNTIVKLELTYRKELTLNLEGFVDGTYEASETVLRFPTNLLNEESFIEPLKELLREYYSCKSETDENIGSLLNKYSALVERKNRIDDVSKKLLYEFAKTKNISLAYDSETLSSVYHHLANNKKRIVQNTNFFGKHFFGRICEVLQFCYERTLLSFGILILLTFCSVVLGVGFSMPEWFFKVVLGFLGGCIFGTEVTLIMGMTGNVDFVKYKQRTYTADKLLEKLEKEYGFKRETVKLVHSVDDAAFYIEDVFYKFILSDLRYVQKHKGVDFGEVLEEIHVLVEEYKIAYKKRLDLEERMHFLEWLNAIEMRMYAKNDQSGFVDRSKIAFGKEDLEKRLEFLGYPIAKKSEDRFLNDVYGSLDGILKMPYARCEVEIFRIYALAFKYAESGIDSDGNYRALGTLATKLFNELEEIESDVTKKRNSLIEDSLNDHVVDEHVSSQELDKGRQIVNTPLE